MTGKETVPVDRIRNVITDEMVKATLRGEDYSQAETIARRLRITIPGRERIETIADVQRQQGRKV